MMRILLVCSDMGSPGGWSTYTRGLLEGLRSAGHGALICVPSVPPLSLLTRPLPFRARKAAKEIRRIFEAEKPDVLHITVEPYALCIPFFTKEMQERTVLTLHGSYGIRLLERFPANLLTRNAFTQMRCFITVSAYTRDRVTEALKREGRHFKEHATIIHNGIAIPKVPDTVPLPGARRIVLVGGVKPRKGVLEAIEALARYRQRSQTPFHFDVYGSCPNEDTYVEKVQARIRELRLDDVVTLNGHASERALEDAYAAASLYLMPAKTTPNSFEGFGIVYLEAAAYGVPSIGPRESGAAEAIVEGETGYHVNPANPAEIAERIGWILDEHQIDTATCRTFAKAHSIEAMALQTISTYKKARECDGPLRDLGS